MKKYLITKTWVVDAENEAEVEAKLKKSRNKYLQTSTVEQIIIKPTIEEVIQHYKTGVGDNCLVCDNVISGPYTDAPGQIRCLTCGTTYQTQGCHLRDEFITANNLKREEIAQNYCDVFEYVPLLKDYWAEVNKRVPFGTYKAGGTITQDERVSFYTWLVKNSKKYKPVYTTFNWDQIEVSFEV